MTEEEVLRALTRQGHALLRLATMTLGTLVEKGVLTPQEAGALVREAATFLPPDEVSDVADSIVHDSWLDSAKALEARADD